MKNLIVPVPYKHPRYSHRVRVFDSKGKRKDHYFTNETEALAFAKTQNQELGKLGSDFGFVSEEERAALAFWRTFAADAAPTPPGLLSVLQDFKTSWVAAKASVSVRDAVAKFLAHQKADSASSRHLASLRSRLGRFSAENGDALVSSITTPIFLDWLNGLLAKRADRPGKALSPVTRHNLTRSIRSFFSFAIDQGWTLANPIPAPKRSKNRAAKLATRSAPAILLPADISKFLEAVRAKAPGLVAFWALKFFAGIRDAEAARMDWSMINLKTAEIHLPATLAKTAEARTVKIRPNLKAWLEAFAKESGKIAPGETTRKRGFKKALETLPGFKFPPNAARHSFGTYHLYKFRKAGETALQLGHKGNPAMLHEYYKNPAAEKFASAFWKILPEAAN